MRIFLDGATGSIGGSVLKNLLAHGHEVTCTARTEEKGKELVAKGAHYILFDLNPETAHQYAELCVGYDAIIHTVLNVNEQGIRAEHIATDALITAARKTAETKPVVLLTTSGCLLNGNTNGSIDEDHDDLSHPLEMVAFRVGLERKVVNASTGNLHGAVIRPVWVYGNSHVDQWIAASKTHNKIVALANNNHISFIHEADLAEMYRLIVENRGTGTFFGSEPEAVRLDTLVERVSQKLGVHEVERAENVWPFVQNYGFFVVAATLDQQIVSKRHHDLYGFTPRHKFLDWLGSQNF